MKNKILLLITFLIFLSVKMSSSILSQCCESCTKEGDVKYYSIDTTKNMCGECCLNPKYFWLYKVFEWGLTKAENNNPCQSHSFNTFKETVTHGAFGITMTLDLYLPDKKVALKDPCCTTCTKPNETKYYSIDRTKGLCGECCIDPKDYMKYKILFEPGLTKADDNIPCSHHGYRTYKDT